MQRVHFQVGVSVFSCQQILRWLNRVMQDHEARASDLNRKLIFPFFFVIFLIKATET